MLMITVRCTFISRKPSNFPYNRDIIILGTGRSVPNTPLQTSPHESGPSSEEQPSHHQVEGTIPSITISGAEDEVEAAESGDCMGPPSVAGTSTDGSQHTEHQSEEIQEGEDGVCFSSTKHSR